MMVQRDMKIYTIAFLIFYTIASTSQTIIVKPYLQDATPASIVIMWETDVAVTGKVKWGESPFALIDSVPSVTHTGSGSTEIHTANLNSLSAQTKYYYRVELASGTASALYHFRTPSLAEDEKTVRLMAISDMQRDGSNPNKFHEIVNQGIIPVVQSIIDTSLSELDAVLIPGDLVVTGGNYGQWKDHFFNPVDNLSPYTPFYPVPGNHEYHGGGLPNFLSYFHLPENGPPALVEQCWFKDISNVRIVGLNSNSGAADKTLQLSWLGEMLSTLCSNEEIDFVFAELHHPYKSELWTPGESDFTGDIIELLENFTTNCGKPSIHFYGHTHGYSRGQSRDHQHLWVNVATAGGNIDYWGEFSNQDYPEFVTSQDEYGFVYVESEAGSDPEFRLTRYSRGDEFNSLNNEIRDVIVVRKNEIAPQTPLAIFPNSDTVESSCLLLKASDFSDGTDYHQASHWQIARNNQFLPNQIIAQKWAQHKNDYDEVDLQLNDDLTDETFENLAADSSYFWRVRYRDPHLKWSEWSTPASFYLINTTSAITGNLINNGGAENDTANWIGHIESLMSNECNSVPAFAGSHLFGVGGICANESNLGEAYQVVDLSPYANQIAQGNVGAELMVYMRDFSGSDVPSAYMTFFDSLGALISTSTSISNASATWLQRNVTHQIPTDARSMRVQLQGVRNAGSDNDSYFDEISMHLVTVVDCANCFASALGPYIDNDEDGFCADIDCQDQDSLSYPGALELCDGIDNNCDGLTDSGDTVAWTGAGDGVSWHDADNWDQQIIPLPCQRVLINTMDSIAVASHVIIKGLEVVSGFVRIDSGTLFHIEGHDDNVTPACHVAGTFVNAGRMDISTSAGEGLRLIGLLVNLGRIYINDIELTRLEVELGGEFVNEAELEVE